MSEYIGLNNGIIGDTTPLVVVNYIHCGHKCFHRILVHRDTGVVRLRRTDRHQASLQKCLNVYNTLFNTTCGSGKFKCGW